MAKNVFGVPITDETLKAMEKYEGKQITRFDRAYEAMNMKNDGDKNVKARDYVDKLKAEYGDGYSTLCVVYNATGDPITLVGNHDWYGHLYKDPYPYDLANGQWGAFLHVKPDWPNASCDGSAAGVVYRGKNANGDKYDYMCSWHTPYWTSYGCKAYTMVREVDHFVGAEEWKALKELTDSSGLSMEDEWYGCVSKVTIGNASSAAYEALLTLQGID